MKGGVHDFLTAVIGSCSGHMISGNPTFFGKKRVWTKPSGDSLLLLFLLSSHRVEEEQNL